MTDQFEEISTKVGSVSSIAPDERHFVSAADVRWLIDEVWRLRKIEEANRLKEHGRRLGRDGMNTDVLNKIVSFSKLEKG